MPKPRNRHFTFKQFSLSDEGCGMKIGTDGVLLGAWAANFASETNPLKILDIGTGCGLIALMIAQKSGSEITAIDNDQSAYSVASENFRASPWSSKLNIIHSSLQDYQDNTPEGFNLIVCNPPYFTNSLLSKQIKRNKARHNQTLTFKELFAHSRRLLATTGNLIIIYPASEQEKINKLACSYEFAEHDRLNICAAPGHSVKRVISNFCGEKAPNKEKKEPHSKEKINEQTLVIEDGKRNSFTPEYIKLTRDYHPFLD